MKPINHIDGWLYIGMAICTSVVAVFGSSEAGQFFSAREIFLIKAYAEILGAAFLAGKTYRSTTFARSQDQQTEPAVPEAGAPQLPKP